MGEMSEGEDKFRESIWAIHSKWRVWFYRVLSISGLAVSAFALYEKWSESWLEIFDVLWSRVFGSVVIVWFGFQVGESAMGAYQSYLDYRAARLRAAEEKRKRFEDALRRLGVSEDTIQNAENLSSSVKNER